MRSISTMPASTAPSVEQTVVKASVLIVDDTRSNLLALAAVLSPLDVRVVEATSGQEALDRVAEEEFAVALLDVRMPTMDGFEVAARMRATTNGQALPIIFLTAHQHDENLVRRGYAVGAADYVTKPFDAEALRARVRAFVELFQQREAIRRAQVALRTRERDDAMRRAVVFERIATAALETADLPEFLHELLQILLSVTDVADSATILLRSGEELHVHASAVAGHEAVAPRQLSVRIGDGFAGRIAATRKPMEIADADERDGELELLVDARGTRALFGVPLMNDGLVLGVAHVGSMRASAFTESDKRLLQAVAGRAAWAVSKQQERARLHAIVNAAPALIAIYRGHERTLELSSPTFKHLFGRGGESAGEPKRSAVHPTVVRVLDDVHQSGEPRSFVELPVEVPGAAEGELCFVNLSAQPLVGPSGVRDSVLVFGVDVTAEVQARREIEAHQLERARLLERERSARQQAENASRAKDEFLATISHELRTPLNAVIGWTARARSKAPPELDRALAIIERNAQSQARIIEDMLDLSRIISGRLRLEVRSISLADPIIGAVEAVRPAAEAKGVQLELEPIEAVQLNADPDRLQQVVWNLVANAIKFTPLGGRVRVSARLEAGRVKLCVADTGQGMEPSFLALAFEPFRQADGSTTRHHGGLGLGLSIVRQLVQAHGGVVRASSPGVGCGSTFEFELPTRAIATIRTDRVLETGSVGSISPPEGHGTRLDGLKVLVVDDEEDARALLVEVLSERGAEVSSAESVAAALETFARFAPDVLVSDIGMPEADGYSLIRRLRAMPPSTGGETPAIALTAYARAQDIECASAAGFQRHLAKPVDADRLVKMVAALARARPLREAQH